MKVKYIVYLLIVILVGGAIAYRFNKNKAQKASMGGRKPGGPAAVLNVNGIIHIN